MTNVEFTFAKIMFFDEKCKKYVDQWVTLRWYDDRLEWDAIQPIWNGNGWNYQMYQEIIISNEQKDTM